MCLGHPSQSSQLLGAGSPPPEALPYCSVPSPWRRGGLQGGTGRCLRARTGSWCLHMFKRLVPCKKKKKNAIAWVEPTQCNVPLSCAGQPWDGELLCAFRPQTLRSALTHTPLQQAAHGGPGHRKTDWDRQVSPGTATLHLSLSPLTHREQCWQGASESPTWWLF